MNSTQTVLAVRAELQLAPDINGNRKRKEDVMLVFFFFALCIQINKAKLSSVSFVDQETLLRQVKALLDNRSNPNSTIRSDWAVDHTKIKSKSRNKERKRQREEGRGGMRMKGNERERKESAKGRKREAERTKKKDGLNFF